MCFQKLQYFHLVSHVLFKAILLFINANNPFLTLSLQIIFDIIPSYHTIEIYISG